MRQRYIFSCPCFACPLLLIAFVMLATGCGSGGGLSGFDPKAAGEAFVAALDKDSSGTVSKEEIDALPALRKSFRLFDLEGKGEITIQDAIQRFEMWGSGPDSSVYFECRVIMKGRPLSGATVKLVPEPFMGENAAVVTGVTDQQGIAILNELSEDGSEGEGVPFGVYKVEITHPSETIDARYNSQTELGQEIAPDTRAGENVEYRLN